MSEDIIKSRLEEGISCYRGKIPESTLEGIRDHVLWGLPAGGFLTAVLTNDLFEATGRADTRNRAALMDICGFVYSYCPGACWGSYEKVDRWAAERRQAIGRSPDGWPITGKEVAP